MEEHVGWINDLLKAAEDDPGSEPTKLLECCGRGCAVRSGHIDGLAALGPAARGCRTHAERVAFLKEALPLDVEDAGDGVVIRLHKSSCTCPMAPDVASPMLCHCTLGHERAVWGDLFGVELKAEILESFLRGGSDCVVKLYL